MPNIRQKCPYCGNTSGRVDSRGMCISCGGRMEVDETLVEVPKWWLNSCSDVSGSSRFLDPYIIGESGKEQVVFQDHIPPGLPVRGTYYGYDLGIYTINEIRKMVGLDEE